MLTNIFEPEQLIVDAIAPLFQTDMVFTEANSAHLNNQFFNSIPVEEDKVGALVLSRGFKSDGLVSAKGSKNQRLKLVWQVAVVCPKNLYYSIGGSKLVELINVLKGKRLSNLYKEMYLIDDERGFNEAYFEHDLVYIPTLFIVESIL